MPRHKVVTRSLRCREVPGRHELPPALATLLESLDHHAVHVLDIELARVDDLAICAYAAQNGSFTPKTWWQAAEQPTPIS